MGNAQPIRPMSRQGCFLDNSVCEGLSSTGPTPECSIIARVKRLLLSDLVAMLLAALGGARKSASRCVSAP